jgi:molybdate transport system substrate-binding protein
MRCLPIIVLSISFQTVSFSQDLLVAAAADLAPLEAPLSAAFLQKSGLHVRFTLGSSGNLARQIENGAPYDVFLSANEEFAKQLEANGSAAPGSLRHYASGRLGLWSADGNVKNLKDLTALRHVAIANPKHAPYGLAAEQALRASNLWDVLQPNLVLGENVRQTYELARTRNADATLTAWTLVKDAGGILISANLHSPVLQTAAIVKSTSHGETARRFIDFLLSPEGQQILSQYGLFPPPAR